MIFERHDVSLEKVYIAVRCLTARDILPTYTNIYNFMGGMGMHHFFSIMRKFKSDGSIIVTTKKRVEIPRYLQRKFQP